ncbi:putative HVA22-like protein g [Senna tora]|uniref:HVA22-like protein n=1 Tax=Senna tora TaxID=362788 RepID=A0A834W066_9FABA|nr:putative HVA22-like protein g [Senna tora]
MLGEFLNRILILALGYAYPGFECYKAVEKNKVQIEELRFWCQYWIIVALVTVLERFTDFFVGWLPMYGEMKVVFYVYLWYPKTKGTAFVYQTFLKPYVSKHETAIDRQLMEWKAKGCDLFSQYWQMVSHMGHSAFFQGIEYLAAQSFRMKANPTPQPQKKYEDGEQDMTSDKRASFESRQNSMSGKNKKWPPSPPPSPSIKRHTVVTPKYRTIKTRPDEEGETITFRDGEDDLSKDSLTQARARLRRLNTGTGSPRTPQSPYLRDM